MIPSVSDFHTNGALSRWQRGAIAAFEYFDGSDWQQTFFADIATGHLVPLKKAAQVYGVHRSTMWRWIHTGRVDCVRSLRNTWWVWLGTLKKRNPDEQVEVNIIRPKWGG